MLVIFNICNSMADRLEQYMGIHSDRNGSCQDIQDEPYLHDLNIPNTDLDNANGPVAVRVSAGTKHQSPWPSMWSCFWLWL